MNPRYLAYCRAHGKTPDEMLAFDQERYPGGCMCGFILWNTEHWTLFQSEHIGEAKNARFRHQDLDQSLWRFENAAAYDVWLQQKYGAI